MQCTPPLRFWRASGLETFIDEVLRRIFLRPRNSDVEEGPVDGPRLWGCDVRAMQGDRSSHATRAAGLGWAGKYWGGRTPQEEGVTPSGPTWLHITGHHRPHSHSTTPSPRGVSEGGGEGVWDPKVCVPKMARQDLPVVNFVFSHDGGARSRCATSQLRHDRMEQGLTEPHTGRSTFLLSSGGAGGGYY